MATTAKTAIKRTPLPATARQPAPARARLSKSERAASKLVVDWMRKSGLDTKALAALQEERRLEIQRFVEKERAKATKHAATSHAAVRDHARALQTLAKQGGFFTVPTFTLDKPVRISARRSTILKMSRIKPFDSFAKIRVFRIKEGKDELFFVFEWTNSSAAPVAIDALTFLSASGFLGMNVEGGLFSPVGLMSVSAQIALGRSERKNTVYETRGVGHLIVQNLAFLPGDGHESHGCDGAFNLTALHHPVAPFQTVRIVVSLTVESECGSGFDSDADFESGPFGVGCPVVVVRVHQKPPLITPD